MRLGPRIWDWAAERPVFVRVPCVASFKYRNKFHMCAIALMHSQSDGEIKHETILRHRHRHVLPFVCPREAEQQTQSGHLYVCRF